MGARILVVEDNAANRELVRYLLASAGHEVLLAIDGAEGVALARARRPALILSDLQMPRLDGYAMLAALRADPACAAIPVVALTAFSMPNRSICCSSSDTGSSVGNPLGTSLNMYSTGNSKSSLDSRSFVCLRMKSY